MARGGRRQPNNPAAVSGPGALARRTDGGAGNQSQPIRVAGGQPYGERQAMENLQASAPMAVQQAPGAPPAQPSAAPAMNRAPVGDLTGPTMRPQEPVASRLGTDRFAQAQQQAIIKQMYAVYPHPSIARMLGETD